MEKLEMHPGYVPAQSTSIPPDGFIVEFPDENKREAGDRAKDLKIALDNALADANADSKICLAKADPNAQDPGTILAVVLGAKASIAVATGIAFWMRRKNQARIRVRYPDGAHTDISGLESRDVSKILQAINR
jgi:hypothetical protein